MEYDNTLEKPRGNWWQRNWKWFVPSGCVILLLIFALLIYGFVSAIGGFMKDNGAYQEAFTKATENETVIEALGEPITQEGMMQGSINYSNGIGNADLRIPVEGPKGEAIIYVIGTKTDDEWSFSKMEIYLKDSQETINLMN